MERLFSPCTRLGDTSELDEGELALFQDLNLDVSTEEFLSAERAFTYSDLYAMLGNEDTIAWLNPHTAVAREGGSVMYGMLSYRLRFTVDGKDIVALARSREHLLEICDVVLRLLAASVIHSVILDSWFHSDGALINAPTLAYLMEQCQSLKVIKLQDFKSLDENQIRVLGAYSRPGLDIELHNCRTTIAGTNALAEVLGRNQGPTNLDRCEIDNSVLADGLRGNSRLKSLRPRVSNSLDDNREVLAIADALRESKGLVELDLSYGLKMRDETWGAICDSLKTHPTLQVLNLRAPNNNGTPAQAVITSRIQALLNMLKMNMSIHTIYLNSSYSEHELFRGSVIPYLETNRFRPRIRAIQRKRPISYRAKVLGRALLSARTDANRFWMI
jgi:hypothetical protein